MLGLMNVKWKRCKENEFRWIKWYWTTRRQSCENTKVRSYFNSEIMNLIARKYCTISCFHLFHPVSPSSSDSSSEYLLLFIYWLIKPVAYLFSNKLAFVSILALDSLVVTFYMSFYCLYSSFLTGVPSLFAIYFSVQRLSSIPVLKSC